MRIVQLKHPALQKRDQQTDVMISKVLDNPMFLQVHMATKAGQLNVWCASAHYEWPYYQWLIFSLLPISHTYIILTDLQPMLNEQNSQNTTDDIGAPQYI